MTERLANDAESTLAADIGASDLTLTVASAALFPGSGNFRVRVEDELMLVTGVAGAVFTVTRGVESTTAAAHASGEDVVHVLTAGSLAQWLSENAPASEVSQAELDDEASTRAAADTALDGRLDTVETALPGLQPLDSDLTAIAALTTTAYGRALLELVDAAAGRTALGLGSAATHAHGDYDVAGAAAAAQAASQPLDSDLTAIAALSTTSFGRALLSLADAAAGRTALGLGTAATSASGDFQPVDSDLTAIAALTTTSFGRSLLTQADAAALATAISALSATIVDAKGDLIVATAADTVARKAVGTDGTFLGADSNASDGLSFVSAGISPGHASTYWQSPQAFRGSNLAVADTVLYALPFYVAKRTSYDRISAYVTTAGTGGTPVVRLGVYANSAGSPGSLMFDASTVSVATTGQKDITISQTLDQGWYWVVAVAQGATTSQASFIAARGADTVNAGWSAQAPGTSNIAGTVATICWRKSPVAGALPTPLGAVSSADFAAPIVWMRAA